MLEHHSLIYSNAKRCHGQAGSSARALIDGNVEIRRQPAKEAGRQMEKERKTSREDGRSLWTQQEDICELAKTVQWHCNQTMGAGRH